MGASMAGHLQRAGYVLNVYNRTPKKASEPNGLFYPATTTSATDRTAAIYVFEKVLAVWQTLLPR